MVKNAVQTFETGDFLNIFLRFWGFWGLFSCKKLSYKKSCSVLREYDEIKEEIKNAENVVKYIIQNQWKLIVSLVKKCSEQKL